MGHWERHTFKNKKVLQGFIRGCRQGGVSVERTGHGKRKTKKGYTVWIKM